MAAQGTKQLHAPTRRARRWTATTWTCCVWALTQRASAACGWWRASTQARAWQVRWAGPGGRRQHGRTLGLLPARALLEGRAPRDLSPCTHACPPRHPAARILCGGPAAAAAGPRRPRVPQATADLRLLCAAGPSLMRAACLRYLPVAQRPRRRRPAASPPRARTPPLPPRALPLRRSCPACVLTACSAATCAPTRQAPT